MSENTDEKLKPCPFCGGKAHSLTSNGSFLVECSVCLTDFLNGPVGIGWYHSEKDAAAGWNDRPSERALIAQLEAAQGNIKELESKVNHYVAAEYAHKHFDQTPDIIKRADSAELELVKVKAELLAAQKELGDLHNQEFQQRLANAEHQLYMKDLAIHNIKASRKAQFRKRLAAEAALSAANERVSQEYPETLPCPVRLEPSLLLGKGLPIAMLFRALSRRADYEAEIAAMTPEQRVEHDQRTREVKKFISECITPRPAGFTVEGE
ncbi:TPA: Lar family restriction alleviation protein [Yersinia enterocolitica]|nr:Lar family restriction alleviation protein [Yersinia enterocolitica]HDU2642825.1 Lar family restriction alleviation protein [Yersinia enterocolitica]HDW8054868.1 Lar family restriction alleviation protein [Yersinia enterocolitica]HDX8417546.1 Lar family restriction alleviation protein [Yersinia enterocolitica]HEF7251662.1 Lar family restriction alleviation protein [Yersinia enterocolitica]